ncbi:MAG: CHASE domain-containing protein [Acidobacteria bacterium]|nr:CHASE domain-containing protein [Acidobacteriota bacterium]
MQKNDKRPNTRRRGFIPAIILITSLVATGLTAWYVSSTNRDRDQRRIRNAAEGVRDSIQDRIELHVNLLLGTAGLFASNDQVTEEDFRSYVERLNLETRHPGVQGVGYSARIRKGEELDIGNVVHSRLSDIEFWPATDAPEFHAILFLEPLDERNRAAIGYDMFSESTRRAAMVRARDTGQPTASGRVTLVQEIDDDVQSGFLIYVPVYAGERTSETVEERRENLQGFVHSPFRVTDLLRGVFGTEIRPQVAFRVYDGSIEDEQLIYQSPQWERSAADSRAEALRTTMPLEVEGRTWILEFVPSLAFIAYSPRDQVPLILAGGLFISLLLYLLSRSQSQARRSAEQLASDLRDANELLEQSERRMRRLVEANIIGIAFGNEQGEIIDANDAFFDLIGLDVYTTDALTMEQLTPPDQLPADRRAFSLMRKTGQYGPWEKTLLRVDGTPVPVLMGIAQLPESENHWVGFVLGLQELKRIELELREEKETLETITRVNQEISAELLSKGVIRTVVDASTRLCGARWGAFIPNPESSSLEDLSHGSLPFDPGSALGRTVSSGELVRLEDAAHHFPVREDPPVRSYLGVPLISRSGEILGGLILAHPQPARFGSREEQIVRGLAAQAAVAIDNARLFEEARRERNVAEEANRAKDSFLASLSHELRTPMTAILGWVRMLEIGIEGEEYEEAVSAIQRSARIQAQLIEDLLDVSRITSGKLRIEPQPVALRSVLEDAVDAILPQFAHHDVSIDVDSEPLDGIIVSADRARLQQAFWNLLSNAIKFSPENGRVEVRSIVTPSSVTIEIQDWGEGIDPEVLPRIFERFRQADASSTRSFGGLGLGLAIVEYVIETHGGKVKAESPGRGRGSTFSITLPRSDAILTDSESQDEGDLVPLTGRKVLVVEDEPDVRSFVAVLLRQCGATVVAVDSAAAAIDALEKTSDFDVIVSDIAMPKQDGKEMIRRIRQMPTYASALPAIALTAYARLDDRDAILAAGFNRYHLKPIDPGDLTRDVHDLTQSSSGAAAQPPTK